MVTLHYTTFKSPMHTVRWLNDTSLSISNRDGPAGTITFSSTEEANKFIMNNLEFTNDATIIFNDGFPPVERFSPNAFGKSLVKMPLVPEYWHKPIPIFTIETLPHKSIKEEPTNA
jgi:hypothetical protein